MTLRSRTNGTNNSKRRVVSISASIKNDDGTYTFIGTRRLHGDMRYTPTKIKRLRRHNKSSRHA